LNLIKNKWVILVLIIAAVVAVAAFTIRDKEKPQYFTSTVSKGDISDVVEATGTINAVTTVQVGSQVSGTIMNLYADFNSRVKKGQIIAKLDPSLFQGALSQAEADLANAKANVASAQANYAKAKAAALQAKQDYDRTAGLTQQGVMSQQQLDAAKASYDAAVAQVDANDASTSQAKAQVLQKQAAVQVARTNVDHCTIMAPIDGTVVARSVDVGQTVAASLQAPTLFTIAQDLTKMQVYAKTDESDVGQMRTGQNVSFKVDAFPKDTFRGQVSQVRMNATTVQNVVTYDTIIDFANTDMRLFPGMTAYVSIPVAEVSNVVRVPNGALRYKPDDAQALLEKNGMTGGQGGRGGQQGPGNQTANANGGAAAGGGGTGDGGGNRRRGGGAAGANAATGGDTGQPGGGAAPVAHREQKQDVATVWKLLPDKTLQPVRVKLGITDHTVSEVVQVLRGELKEGDALVIGASASKAASGSAPRPGMAPGGAGGAGGGRGR
jgi:HlyD family secretion protein